MKIFILSDANSIHTKRWVSSLAKCNIDIYLFSLAECSDDYYLSFSNVEVYGCFSKKKESISGKLKYLTYFLFILKCKIRKFNPDILHAHFASSYGLLGALANFHPYILSIWGSDVYVFPHKSFLNRKILEYGLKKADKVLSTSYIMANEISKYTPKTIEITPFGVDTSLFKRFNLDDNNSFIIGHVKALSPKYGIDILIKAFNIVLQNNPQLDLRLEIIGEGHERNKLENLARSLEIFKKVFFIGNIDNIKLPEYYNRFSVAVFPSIIESFGVVAIEAMACECPIVTSDADGFTEVVKNGETGFIVPRRDIRATAKAIQMFIDNPQLKTSFGKNGRKRVLDLYDWNNNVKRMLEIYNKIVK